MQAQILEAINGMRSDMVTKEQLEQYHGAQSSDFKMYIDQAFVSYGESVQQQIQVAVQPLTQEVRGINDRVAVTEGQITEMQSAVRQLQTLGGSGPHRHITATIKRQQAAINRLDPAWRRSPSTASPAQTSPLER